MAFAHAGAPHEALYEGFFLEPAAFKQYCAMFAGSSAAPRGGGGGRVDQDEGRNPYAPSTITANAKQLQALASGRRVLYRACNLPAAACTKLPAAAGCMACVIRMAQVPFMRLQQGRLPACPW